MNSANPSTTIPDTPAQVYYPGSDGEPMAETFIHVLVMLELIGTLRQYFRHHSDVFVIGNIFLYYEEGHPESRRTPDVMVVKGVDSQMKPRSFKTWEQRAMPSVIFEITSKQTADEDFGPKRELYERLGVREYFLFDPLHEYLERPLMGYRLIRGEYEPLPSAEDGGVLSSELGLRLVPDGENLALIQFRTGERLPRLMELHQTLQETQDRASQAEQLAKMAEQLTKMAEQRAQMAEQDKSQAEQRAQMAEQNKSQAEQRAKMAEQDKSQAEQRAKMAEQDKSQAEQRAQTAEQRAAQLIEELARLRALLPSDPNESESPQQ